jgi:serine/threonine protein kinase
VFSFGSLMFKVLTGRPPFAGETASQVLEAIATTAPPFLREVAVGVPEDLQAICLACLAWNPADRPTASEIALELGRFLVGEPVRLKPKLYDDLLRRSISEYSSQARGGKARASSRATNAMRWRSCIAGCSPTKTTGSLTRGESRRCKRFSPAPPGWRWSPRC